MKSSIKQQAEVINQPSQPTGVFLTKTLAMSLGFCQMFAETFSSGRVITIYALFIVSLHSCD